MSDENNIVGPDEEPPPFDPNTAPDWAPLHDPWFDTDEGEQWRQEHGGDKPGEGAGDEPSPVHSEKHDGPFEPEEG